MRRALLSVVALATSLLIVPFAGTAVGSSASGVVEVTADGDFCVYSLTTETMACVSDPIDLDYALSAAVEGLNNVNLLRISALVSSLASITIGTFYDNTGYDTSAGSIAIVGNACDAGTSPRDSGWNPMGTWANRVSSFKTGTGSGCYIRLWTGASYTGTSLSYRASSSNVGATMNDNAQSVEFS